MKTYGKSISKGTRVFSLTCEKVPTRPVFIAAAVFAAFLLAFALFSARPVSEVSAAGTLPVFQADGVIYCRDNDAGISVQDSNAALRYNELRSLYGASGAEYDPTLAECALYAAIGALCETDAQGRTQDGVDEAAENILDGFSAVDGFLALYCEDYVCVSGSRASAFALNSLVNTYYGRNMLLASGTKLFGTASVQLVEGERTAYCFVICFCNSSRESASSKLNAASALLPSQYYELSRGIVNSYCGTAIDETADIATVYVKKSEHLSTQSVLSRLRSELGFYDRRGNVPEINWDASSEITSETGAFSLPVSLTIGGITCGRTLGVEVVAGTQPVFAADAAVLPSIPAGEIWNVASYVPAADAAGPVTVSASPVAVVSGGSIPETVTVTCTNALGMSVTAVLPVSCAECEYQKVVPVYTDNKGLNANVVSGAELAAKGHALVTWSGTSGNGGAGDGEYYKFTFTYQDGFVSSFDHASDSIAWNPERPGVVTVTAERYSGGTAADSACIKIIVAEAAVIVYNDPGSGTGNDPEPEPALSFSPESGYYVIETGEILIVRGVRPETVRSGFAAAVIVTGKGAGWRLLKADGSEVPEDGNVAAGQELVLTSDGETVKTYIIVIPGDINGDGKVGVADFAKLRQHLLKGGIIDGAYEYASDLNGDGKTGIADFAKLRQYLLGNVEIDF